MISKTILDQAKSFLCWDIYSDITIKLIPIDDSVAFFYPPSRDLSTLIVFYQKNCFDFSKPLFLLFHEVGHYLQFKRFKNANKITEFMQFIDMDKGHEKVHFEKQAWDYGETVFKKFLDTISVVDSQLLNKYAAFRDLCIQSYL